MRKLYLLFIFSILLSSCKSAQTLYNSKTKIQVNIDLINVKNDKVSVELYVPKIQSEEIVYYFPKIIPGTYSEDNYGKFIDNLQAYDINGASLSIVKIDANSWKICSAKTLHKITYLVDDTFDVESSHKIFSPAGTNISPDNYLLNTHGFVGYFSEFKETPYQLNIAHPENLFGATSMIDFDQSESNDVFRTFRYAELVENPIMYSKPNFTKFTANGIEILISVFSPNNKITAEGITPKMKEMILAQKKFLKKFNTTKKYTILVYFSETKKTDPQGFGALEHPTITTVVLPEKMGSDELNEQLKDIVSHEFFHIITPLTIHSNEIQDFDYNNPKMSKHLWMYEGVTEYFANLFQINQGLISENDFYKRIETKIENASNMNDTIPFTEMSAKVLENPYKNEYPNVYEKGALIAMCLDIQLRESSKGKSGILDLMRKLSNKYGVDKPFNDAQLFSVITKMTNAKIGNFLETYVSGSTPIPYYNYLEKVGVTKAISKKTENIFLKDEVPCIVVNEKTKEISIALNIELSEFYNNLGIQNNDIIMSVNNKKYNLDSIYDLINESQNWKNNDAVVFKIKRKSKILELKGVVILPLETSKELEAVNKSKKTLKNAWLKG